MIYKKLIYGNKLKKKLAIGVNKISNAVKITLGPKGKNVIIYKELGDIYLTKDGVTVAKEIILKDKVENLGAKIVKEIALKTNEDVGDGTTTATVLSQSIIKESFKYINIGKDPIKIKNQLNSLLILIIKRLKKMSKKINSRKEIFQVSCVSSNNDINIGRIICSSIDKVGKNGIINVEEGKNDKDEIEIVKGIQIDKGFLSPYFLSENKNFILLENCYVFIYGKKINNIRKIIPLLEKVSSKGNPLLIICEDIDSDVLTSLILNNMRGTVKAIPIKSPSFGEKKESILEDISILVNTNYVRSDSIVELKKIKVKNLGIARKVEIRKDTTTIIGNKENKKKIHKRIKFLKEKLENESSDYEIDKIKERIARLSGGVALIKVGGSSEIEIKERKYRIEDSINATKAAMEKGIVPGGGISLIRVSEWLKNKFSKNKNIGFKIIYKSMKKPFIQILKNSNLDYKKIFNKVKRKYYEFGYDVNSGKYCNMIKSGIIDPTKVVINSVKNSISLSNLVITSECFIYQNKESIIK